MSARSRIRPALDVVRRELVRRGLPVDAALLRQLRDFGLACFDAGVEQAHSAPTIPVPAAGPDASVDDVTGRYSLQHPLNDSRVIEAVNPKKDRSA